MGQNGLGHDPQLRKRGGVQYGVLERGGVWWPARRATGGGGCGRRDMRAGEEGVQCVGRA
jgi:hypothetical protein